MEQNSNNEISLADLFRKFGRLARYIKSKGKVIMIWIGIGIAAGLCYSLFKKPTYTAVCTFVLEDSKQGGLGQYSGLASLVGINVNSSSGIFEGDNILELYKSRAMIEKALLSTYNFGGKSEQLIDRFIDMNGLRASDKAGSNGIGNISFSGDPASFNRKQDSIITSLVTMINKKVLSVSKPDKKLSIINVEVTSVDEGFSKSFSDKIVQTVNNFYVQTKTKKALQNVQTLQKQADSIRLVLNSSIYGVANANDAAPNANPFMSSLHVPSQKRQIDVQASSTIYNEIVKNLEVAKMSLREEAPLVQVIDAPVLPLKKNKFGKIKGIISGGVIFGLISVLWFSIGKIFQNVMKNG